MIDYRNINLAVELLSALTSVFMLVCLLMAFDRKGRQARIMLHLMLCNILVLLTNLLTWSFNNEEFAHATPANRVVYYVLLCARYFMIPLFTSFIVSLIPVKDRFLKKFEPVMYITFAFVVIILVALRESGLYYLFEDRIDLPRRSFFMSRYAAMFLMLANTAVIAIYFRRIDRIEAIFIAFFGSIPIVAITLETFCFHELELLPAATTLALMVIGVGVSMRQARELRVKELELVNSRIDIMLSQIQPHFLYNSLVVIRHLCKSDPELAAETVLEFSNYLRGNMDSLSQKTPIPFERELRHVENYLSIEKKRFGNKLNVIYDIRFKNFTLPVLTLQPIVENAVRYGVTKKEGGGTVKIIAVKHGNSAIITVIDDGIGFNNNSFSDDDNSGRTHVGIANVSKRLQAMCGGTLHITSKQNEGTSVFIIVPV